MRSLYTRAMAKRARDLINHEIFPQDNISTDVVFDALAVVAPLIAEKALRDYADHLMKVGESVGMDPGDLTALATITRRYAAGIPKQLTALEQLMVQLEGMKKMAGDSTLAGALAEALALAEQAHEEDV